MPTLVYTTQEAADQLRCSRQHVDRLIRSGRLKAIKPFDSNGHWRIRHTDLVALLESAPSNTDGSAA